MALHNALIHEGKCGIPFSYLNIPEHIIPEHIIIEYMQDPELPKKVHITSFAILDLGNKYLLRTSHYDKILDWLHHAYPLEDDTILFIINKIESDTTYTSITLCILIKLLWISINRHLNLHAKIFQVIENCIFSIPNFNVLDILTTSCGGGGNYSKDSCSYNYFKPIIPRYGDYTDYKIKIIELCLTCNAAPITQDIMAQMTANNFIILEPSRFIV